MKNAICVVAAAPVRKDPNHRSEMVNQLLFGETMQVIDVKDEWFKIKSTYDDYEGWLTCHLIAAVDPPLVEADDYYIASLLTNPVTLLPDQLINAPMGSILTGFDEETGRLWDPKYQYHGTFRKMNKSFDSELLKRTIQQWINAPYLWGGKTFMGVDCSGFVQTVCKFSGVKLKRDAWQQAEQGDQVDLENSKQGDLAFFHNENGRVIHVGIVLENSQIAHASGKVRIDKFDDKGIVNVETGKRTHQLHSIRRVV